MKQSEILKEQAKKEIKDLKLRLKVDDLKFELKNSSWLYSQIFKLGVFLMSEEKRLTNPRAIALQEVKDELNKDNVKRYKNLFRQLEVAKKVVANLEREIEELDFELDNSTESTN